MSSLSKRQKEIGLIILASLFLIALAAYSYYIVYTPAKEKNDQLEQMVESERDVLFALRKEAAEQEPADSSSTFRAQQKVPVKALEDAVLLQVTQAEIKSDSLVKGVKFGKSEFEILSPPENVENLFGLQVTVELEMSPYPNLIKFIDELEQMERIFIMDSIEFTAPSEVTTVGIEEKSTTWKVSFYAFYRDDLDNLLDEVPKVNAQPGSQKLNPFPYNYGHEEGEK